jgi:hypothetical protein
MGLSFSRGALGPWGSSARIRYCSGLVPPAPKLQQLWCLLPGEWFSASFERWGVDATRYRVHGLPTREGFGFGC